MTTLYRFLVCFVVCLLSPFSLAQSAAQPQILAKIVEREFLYNFGLSYPGTLGVDSVRYTVEVVDAWKGKPEWTAGTKLILLTPGGCEGLMKKGDRYFVAVQVVANDVTATTSNSLLSQCDVVSEASAKDAIAELNRARANNQSAPATSANPA